MTRTRRFTVRLLAGAAALAAAAMISPAVSTTSVAAPHPDQFATKDAVALWYKKAYLPAEFTPVGATGDPAKCQAGGFSERALRMMQLQANAIRALAGLDRVELKADPGAQQAAMMMSANGALSHGPPPSWKCYTEAGREAAGTSNLMGGGGGGSMANAVAGYMYDSDASNTEVGHRRWVLHPATTQMGVGQTDSANALRVIGVPSNDSATAPAYTPWPREGWFPTEIDPDGRWSLTMNARDAKWVSPTVSVTKNGKPLPPPKVYEPAYGYGNPTLVWDMPDVEPRVGDYTVTVTGAEMPGAGVQTKTYTVRLFKAS